MLAIPLTATDAATAPRFYQRFKWNVTAPIEADRWAAGRLRCRRLARSAAAGTDHVVRLASEAELSAQRLLGGTSACKCFPERWETVAGECLGCLMQFAIDVWLSVHRPRRCRPSSSDPLQKLPESEPVATDPSVVLDPHWVAPRRPSRISLPSELERYALDRLRWPSTVGIP